MFIDYQIWFVIKKGKTRDEKKNMNLAQRVFRLHIAACKIQMKINSVW